MPLTDCLDAEELQAYQLGKLPGLVQDRIARHLEDCAACEALADRLDNSEDPVMAALRQFPPDANTPTPFSTSAVEPVRRGHLTLPKTEVDARTEVDTTAASGTSFRLIGDYEVLGELGRGGMGVVYKAHQRRLNRTVALKMVLSGPYATPAELTRFFVEAEMVARLTHPSIVQIYDVGEHEGMPYLALEFVSGGTLAAQMRGQPWPVGQAAALVEQLARAIHHAHQRGVVHRDLKPANILIDPHSSVPKITDFGLARAIQGAAGITRTGILVGTPAYMAPEQAGGDVCRVGPASDIYALGVILYELLTGQRPFRGENPVEVLRQVESQEAPSPSRVRPGLPRDLSTICLHCLEKAPSRRYESAAALADDLRRFLDGAPIQARPVGRLERTWKWARRRPALALLLLTIAITLPTGTGVSTYFAVNERRRAQDLEISRGESLTARRASDLNAAELTFRAALADAESGLVDRASFRLLEALRLAPEDAADFRRVLCTNVAMLAQRLPVLERFLSDRRRGWFVGPDGATLVTSTLDNVLEYWDTGKGQKRKQDAAPRALPEEPIELTSDGRVVLTITRNPRVLHLRDATTGESLGASLPAGDVAFAGDGLVLSISQEIDRINIRRRAARFLSTRTGQALGPTIQDDFRLLTAKNGHHVLMTYPNRRLTKADVTSPAHFFDLETHLSLDHLSRASLTRSSNIVFDGHHLVTLDTNDGTVRWWDPNTGSPIGGPWRPPRLRSGFSPFSALTADGRTMLGLGTDDRVRWFHPATGQSYNIALGVANGSSADSPVSSPEGNRVLAVSQSNELRLWRIPALPPLPRLPNDAQPHFAFNQVAFSPDRRSVFVGGCREPTLLAHLMDTLTGQPLGPSYRETSEAPAFSADSKRLATSAPPVNGQEARILVREVATGKILWNRVSNSFVHSLALDATGHHLAVGRFGIGLLIDLDTGGSMRLPQAAGVSQMLFSPDGQWLVTGSQAGWGDHKPSIRIWNVTTGQVLGKEVETTDAARFCFAEDGRTLLALELREGRLRRWKVGTDLAPDAGVYLHPHRRSTCGVFRGDAGQVLVGFANGSAQMYDTTSGKAVGMLLSHASSVVNLAYSPDGLQFAVGCDDGTVQLWDAATAKPLGPPLIHRYPIRGIAFTTDGRTLLAATTDGSTRSWPLAEPVPDDLEKLTTCLQAVSGCRLEGTSVSLLDYSAWDNCRRRFREMWPEAAAALDRPGDAVAWHQAGAREAENQGDAEGVLWHLDQLRAEMSPTTWNADLNLRAWHAHTRALLGQRGAAADEYRQLEEAGPKDALLSRYRFHADRRVAMEQWDFALWYLDRAVSLQPDDWRLYEQRADVHGRLGQTQQQGADLARAVELGGTGRALVALAAERVAEQRWQEAQALLEKADGPWPLGLVLVWNKEQEAYQKLCVRQLKVAAEAGEHLTPEAAHMFARLRLLEPQADADLQPAIKLAENVLAATPNLAVESRQEVLATLGGLLARSGQNEEALRTLRQALAPEAGKDIVRVWLYLALTYHQMGQHDTAREWLARAEEPKVPASRLSAWESLEVRLLCRELDRILHP